MLATPDVDARQCDVIRRELGLNEPVITQYFDDMGGVLRGDLGTTPISKRDVWEEIRTYFWDKDIENYRPTSFFPFTHAMKTWRDRA